MELELGVENALLDVESFKKRGMDFAKGTNVEIAEEKIRLPPRMKTDVAGRLDGTIFDVEALEEIFQEPFEVEEVDVGSFMTPVLRRCFPGEEKRGDGEFCHFFLLEEMDAADFKGVEGEIFLVEIGFGHMEKSGKKRGAKDGVLF